MVNLKLSTAEKAILLLTASVLTTGMLLFFFDLSAFKWFVTEDSVVEWLTVAGLFAGTLICFYRVATLFGKKSSLFVLMTMLLGLALLFVLGEEISWGQRIFNLTPPEYFKEHNSQQETNIHNLVINGVRLNRVVFTYFLISLIALYLLIFPALYNRNEKIRKLMNRCAVPVARFYQVAGFAVVFVVTAIIKHGKVAEMLECCSVLLFYLVIRYPANKEIFRK